MHSAANVHPLEEQYRENKQHDPLEKRVADQQEELKEILKILMAWHAFGVFALDSDRLPCPGISSFISKLLATLSRTLPTQPQSAHEVHRTIHLLLADAARRCPDEFARTYNDAFVERHHTWETDGVVVCEGTNLLKPRSGGESDAIDGLQRSTLIEWYGGDARILYSAMMVRRFELGESDMPVAIMSACVQGLMRERASICAAEREAKTLAEQTLLLNAREVQFVDPNTFDFALLAAWSQYKEIVKEDPETPMTHAVSSAVSAVRPKIHASFDALPEVRFFLSAFRLFDGEDEMWVPCRFAPFKHNRSGRFDFFVLSGQKQTQRYAEKPSVERAYHKHSDADPLYIQMCIAAQLLALPVLVSMQSCFSIAVDTSKCSIVEPVRKSSGVVAVQVMADLMLTLAGCSGDDDAGRLVRNKDAVLSHLLPSNWASVW